MRSAPSNLYPKKAHHQILVTQLKMRSPSDNSCLGVDCLTPKFYKKYWGILKKYLRDAYQHMFESGEMPVSLFEGLIYLIPKTEGVSEDIRKWRPITLLITSYKIFAKLLSSRLQEVVPKIIHISQTRLNMQERSIMDNVFNILGGHCSNSEKQTKPSNVVVGF